METTQYIAYLLSAPKKVSCVQAGEVMEVSHDEVNRFLANEYFSGKDLYEQVKSEVTHGGTLTLDDTVIDKPYSQIDSSDLVGRYWSGRHHKVVVGINLLTLHYTPPSGGRGFPVNYRLYRKSDNKTKHDYFRTMLAECLSWGIAPDYFTADSYYASLSDLKFLKYKGINFMIGLKANRLISTIAHQYERVEQAKIPKDGLYTHIKGFDFVKVFKTEDDNHRVRYYAIYKVQHDNRHDTNYEEFSKTRKIHWNVEKSYRLLKQECHLGHFFVRNTSSVINHVFCALRAFQKLVYMAQDKIIQSVYQLQRKLFIEVQREFIYQVA